MQQTLANCTRLEAIGQGRIRVQLHSDIRPAPGQFVLCARPDSPPVESLRRVIFPSRPLPNGFEFELLPGDPLQPLLAPGSTLDLIGPLGRGLSEVPTQTRLLLIANLEPATLLPLASHPGNITTLLLGQPYPIKALSPEIEVHIGHLPTLVKDYVNWAEQVFVYTIPDRRPQLLHALHATGFDPARVWVLLKPAMPCGVGACQACAVLTRRGVRWACIDGPMFKLSDIEV